MWGGLKLKVGGSSVCLVYTEQFGVVGMHWRRKGWKWREKRGQVTHELSYGGPGLHPRG
jgi:hypothetical protein